VTTPSFAHIDCMHRICAVFSDVCSLVVARFVYFHPSLSIVTVGLQQRLVRTVELIISCRVSLFVIFCRD